MRPALTVASDLERRADIRSGDSIAALLIEAARVIRELVGKKRSSPQHRRFFALIKAAWKHWPSSHEVQAGSPEGLRDYLQIKAGFGIPHKIVRGDTTYIWFEHKSIAYDKMDQDEFGKLAEKVELIIQDIVGVAADELLERDKNET